MHAQLDLFQAEAPAATAPAAPETRPAPQAAPVAANDAVAKPADDTEADASVAKPAANDWHQSMTLQKVRMICGSFQNSNFCWPTAESTAEEFELAYLSRYNGAMLAAMVRDGTHGLDRDPAYQALRYKKVKDCGEPLTLADMDPRLEYLLTDGQIVRLFQSAEVDIQGYRDVDMPRKPGISLHYTLPAGLGDDNKTGGKPNPLLSDVVCRVVLPPTPELIGYLDRAGLFYGSDPATLHEHYHAEVLENGRMYMKYQSILGSREMGQASPEHLKLLHERVQPLFREAIDVYLARQQHRKAMAVVGAARSPGSKGMNFEDLEQALTRLTGALDTQLEEINALCDSLGAPKEAQNVRPAPAKTSASPAKMTLAAELSLLEVEGQHILLPEQNLKHYGKIKQLIETAGGRYVQNKQRFTFDDGIDASEVLDGLISGKKVNFKKDFQFFATPAAQGEDLRDALALALGSFEGKRILEPSAGDGALADLVRERGADVVVVEPWKVNALKLISKGYTPIEQDFLTLTKDDLGVFDAIIANPPFTKDQDIDHVRHMFNFLEPGGSLSVIMSTVWQDGKTKKHRDFLDFLATQNVTITPIKAGAFNESGTTVPTVRLDFVDCQPEASARATRGPRP